MVASNQPKRENNQQSEEFKNNSKRGKQNIMDTHVWLHDKSVANFEIRWFGIL